jgi:CIC family chloride channel protein
VGILYARAFYATERLFERLPAPRLARPALGGLAIGVLGLALPQAIHTGYGWEQLGMAAEWVLSQPLWLIALLPFAKILATSLTVGSGGSGGIFGPGMVIGGLLGTAFWRLTYGWLPGVPASPAPFAIVGMMALFGSIAHAPLAVVLMVAEMTGNLSLLAPAMVALGLATLVVGDESIYVAQLANRAESPAHRYRFSFPLLSSLPVRAALVAPPAVLREDTSVEAAAAALAAGQDGTATGAPVLSRDGAFLGTVTPTVLDHAAAEAPARQLRSLVDQEYPTAAPNDTLDVALQQMAEHNRAWLPVVEPGTGKLLGVVTTSSALQRYREAARNGARRLGGLVEGTVLTELRVQPGTPLAWQPLAAAGLPAGAIVIALHRQGDVVVPRGGTTLRPGDLLFIAAVPAAEAPLQAWIGEKAAAVGATDDGNDNGDDDDDGGVDGANDGALAAERDQPAK